MHRLPITLLAVLATVALTRAASAADMPVKAPIVPPAFDWTGFYAGVNAGFGWGRNDADFSGDGQNNAGNDLISRVFDGSRNFNSITRSQRIDAEGPFGGAQVGYNWQVAGVWVAGLEADIQWSGLDGNVTRVAPLIPLSLSAEQKLNWFGTARGRLGYLINERTLVFGTAGVAYGETEVSSSFFANGNDTFIGASTSLHCPAGAPCLGGQGSNTSAGWTAGAGVEWAATNKVTVKFEYLHIALPDSQIIMSAIAPATGNATVTANFRNQFDIVRAGLNFRF